MKYNRLQNIIVFVITGILVTIAIMDLCSGVMKGHFIGVQVILVILMCAGIYLARDKKNSN
jgi:hypothetical protein